MLSAIKSVWKFYSMVIFTCTALFVLLPDYVIINNTPVCESKILNGSECFMCGMTHAFSSIGKGNLIAAMDFNRGSIFLFIIFATNSALFLVYSLKNIFKRKGNKL